jgi:hypothetical protein
MLARVQIEHEVDQGAFELRSCTGETNETAAAEFRCPFQIEQIQSRADPDVISRVGQLRFLAPTADNAVSAGIFAKRNGFVRQVWNIQKQFALLFVERVGTLG